MSYAPREANVKFPFSWKGTIVEGAAGVGAVQVFRANSVYYPDYTGVGTQPLGVPIWTQLFQYFRVQSMSYQVTFASVVNLPCLVGIVETSNPALSSQALAWLVERDSRARMLSPIGGGRDVTTFSGKVLPWRAQDKTRDFYMNADSSLGGMGTANPGAVTFLVCYVIGYSASASVSMRVKLSYDTQLIGRTEFNET